MPDNNFHLEISNALTGCQFVEKELKNYLAIAFESALRQQSPLDFSIDDLESRPLGRLIKNFAKAGGSAELCAELTKFKDERDFLAHQAAAQCFDLDMNYYMPDAIQARLAEIQISAEVLRRSIYDAGVLLEFDCISDAG